LLRIILVQHSVEGELLLQNVKIGKLNYNEKQFSVILKCHN
jgi:hypothetical protein